MCLDANLWRGLWLSNGLREPIRPEKDMPHAQKIVPTWKPDKHLSKEEETPAPPPGAQRGEPPAHSALVLPL